MRWEGCEWIECSTGGGEQIKGYEGGGPPTLCQPASQQGGGEEVKYPGRRSLEGVGGVLGAVGNFLVSLHFLSRNLSPFSWVLEIGRVLPGASFWPG